jgi:predicted ferric reductase
MRRAIGAGALLAVAALIVGDAVAARLGLTAGAIPRAAGPWLWIGSRAAGVAGFVALTLEVGFGLLVSTGAGDGWIARARAVDLHGWLSAIALALIGGHALALAGDGFVRFDVLDAVVPFVAPYRPFAVGLGVIAAWLAIVVHVSFRLRRRLGARAWRRLHYLSFAVFALAVVHGLAAGSDADRTWLRLVYAGALALVTGLTIVRIVGARGARRPARPASAA